MFIPGPMLKIVSYPGFIAANHFKRFIFNRHEAPIEQFEPFDLLEEPIQVVMPDQFRKYYFSMWWQMILLQGFAISCLEIADLKIHWIVELIMVWIAVSIGAHALPRFEIIKRGWKSIGQYAEAKVGKWMYRLIMTPLAIVSLLGYSQLGYVYILLIYFEYYTR